MCQKALRTSLAALLIAVTLISLLPISYAGPAARVGQQPGASNRPRRGKNGLPADKNGPREAAATQQNNNPDNQSERSGETPSTEKARVVPAGRPATDSDQPEAAVTAEPTMFQQTKSDRSSQSGRAGSHREPPPFDRPPIGSQPRPQDAPQRRDPQPAGRPQPQEPSVTDSTSPSSSPADADYEQQDRTGRQRPVLRRPADSRPQGGEQTRPTGTGQQPSDPPQQGAGGEETIKLDATLVNIPLLVSDRAGRYIPKLSEKDFILYEDGVQQEVAFFGNEEVPFNVALVLDMSPSVQGNAGDIQDAAIEFVQQLRPQDRVMVVSFDRNVDYLTDFTNNRRVLESAIRSVQTGSGTSVYDAVYSVVAQKLRMVEGRKAIILLSDGEDTTSSHASYDEAVDIVSESDVLVYGLRYPGGGGRGRVIVNPRTRIPQIPFPIPWPWPFPRRRRGNFTDPNFMMRMGGANPGSAASAQSWPRRGRNGDFMADITAAGGGPVYDAERISDLRGLAVRIAEELRHVYVISYYPTNSLTNGGFREIRIRIKGRDDIAVRHRKGYNAREINSRRTT